jgi:CRP-like cAMP-binding protein
MPMRPRVPEKPTVLAALHSSTLLNVLKEEEVAQLAQVSHLAFADRAEVIWLTGAETAFCGLVAMGFVKMVRSSTAGLDLTAEIMGPGQIFGLMGAIEGSGCPLSARAVCPTWYLKMPKQDLLSIYARNGGVKERLVLRLTTRLRQAYDLMSRMASGKVEQRLAAVLIILGEHYGLPREGGFEVTVPLTRQDLAELAGTTVETTIRVLSRWQKDGLVEWTSRTVWVKDQSELASHLEPA